MACQPVLQYMFCTQVSTALVVNIVIDSYIQIPMGLSNKIFLAVRKQFFKTLNIISSF